MLKVGSFTLRSQRTGLKTNTMYTTKVRNCIDLFLYSFVFYSHVSDVALVMLRLVAVMKFGSSFIHDPQRINYTARRPSG